MSTNFTATNYPIGIRPYQLEDATGLCEAVLESNENVSQYLPWNIIYYTPEIARDWIATRPEVWRKNEQFSFVIYNTLTGQFLGGIEIDRLDAIHKTANLGYWVRTSATKHGIASIAAALGARFAFQELKLNRLEIVMDIDNIASQIVAEKIGAKKEGLLRKRMMHHNKFHDSFMYSLLPEDITSPQG